MNLFEQAKHWAGNEQPVSVQRQANEALSWVLAREEEYRAHQTVTHALAFDAARRRGCIPQSGLGAGEDDDMQSKSGLHPYRAGLYFILRESNRAKSPARARAAIVAGDIAFVADRQPVRMLAAMFDKTDRQVARDLINEFRALEHGEPAP